MPPSTAQPITEQQWNAYKDTIRHLVLEEELSQAEILTTLAKRGFHVTRAQLGLQLKKWNFCRRLKPRHWEAIGHRISKRKAAGKDSAVIISGLRISERKVARQARRCKPLLCRGKSPVLEFDVPVNISTPRSPTTSSIGFAWKTKLPWFEFQDCLNIFDRLVLSAFEKSQTQSLRITNEYFTSPSIGAWVERESRRIPAVDRTEPENHDQDLTHQSAGRKFRDLVKVLIFKLSNNLHAIDDDPWGLFLVLVKQVGPANLPVLEPARRLTDLAFLGKILGLALKNDPEGLHMEPYLRGRYDLDRATYLGIIRWVIECGYDLDTRIKALPPCLLSLVTPLQLAVINRTQDVVALLLDCGASVDSGACLGCESSSTSFSPLELALGSLSVSQGGWCPMDCHSGNLIRLLLDRGAGRDTRCRDRQLEAAIRAGNLEVARRLLQYGANLHFEFPYGAHEEYTPRLYHHHHHTIVMETALTAAAEFESHTSSKISHIPIGESTEFGVLTDDMDCEATIIQLLCTLIKWLNGESQQMSGIDQDRRLIDVAVIAASRNHTRVLRWLVEMGVKVGKSNSKGISPFFCTIAEGHLASCQLLLNNSGLRLSGEYSNFALQAAVAFGSHDILEALISAQANIHSRNDSREIQVVLSKYQARAHNIRLRDEDFGGTALDTAMRDLRWCDTGVGNTGSSAWCAAQSCEILIRAGATLTGGELVLGAYSGNADLVNLALAAGAPINETAKACQRWHEMENRTSLQLAASCLHPKIVRTLLRAGANLKGNEQRLAMRGFSQWKTDQDHATASLFNVLSLLEQYGAKAATACEWAFGIGSSPLIQWACLRSPSSYDSGLVCGMTQHASRTNCPRTMASLQAILDLRASNQTADTLETTAIAIATLNPVPCPILSLLLSHITPSSYCYLPFFDFRGYLIRASVWGHNALCANLFDEPCFWRMNPIRASPLAAAALASRADSTWLLLNHGMCPDIIALLCAIQRRSLDIADRFLAEGIQDGFCDEWENMGLCLPSPVSLAIVIGDLDMVRLLIQRGENVDGRWGPEGHTPLQLMAKADDWSAASYLLDAGADINAGPSIRGATALQFAAMHGHLDFTRRLLDRGTPGNVNAHRASEDGRTALEGAAENGRLEIVQLLLSYGAKLSGSGQRQYLRAIIYAEQNGHLAVSRLLREQRDWTCDDKWRFDHGRGRDHDRYNRKKSFLLDERIGSTASECSDSECPEEHDPSFWEEITEYYCSSCCQNHPVGIGGSSSEVDEQENVAHGGMEGEENQVEADIDVFMGAPSDLESYWNQWCIDDHVWDI